MNGKRLAPPEESAGDVAHSLARAGLSVVPLIGGPLVELFNLVIQPPLERRRKKWMESIAERIEELEAKGEDISALGEDENFVSAVMSASQIALRTHKEEKIDALRNAVFNAVGPQAPDEAMQSIFFELIDSLSLLHIQFLKFARQPIATGHIYNNGLVGHLEASFPQLSTQHELLKFIWGDLFNRGLVNTTLDRSRSRVTFHDSRITPLGAKFLDFIAHRPGID